MKKEKFIIIIILALVLPRIPLLFTPFIDVDETLFAVFARIWQHGGVPYLNAVETKAMGIYYFYSFASWLAGSLPEINMTAVHLLSILWTGLTAWVIGRMASRIAGQRAGLWAALFFVLFTTFYFPKIIAASMDLILLLPCCLAMDLLLRDADEISVWRSAAAGALVSAGMIIKYQAGIMIPVILVYFWILRLAPRKALLQSLAFGLGGLPLPAAMLWHLHGLGAIPDFIYWSLGGSLRYISSTSGTINVWRKLLTHVLTFVASTALVWLLSAQRLLTWWRSGWTAWRRDPCEAAIWVWFFLSMIAVCMGKRFYGHYFLLLMPQLSILAALQFVSWDAAAWARHRKWIIAGILIPLVGSMALRLHKQPLYRMMSEEVIEDYQSYGDYLKALTQPTDRILVWGYSPAVYWYAERLPATRYLWSDVLVGRVTGIQRDLEAGIDYSQHVHPETWEMFFADLNQTRPAYIIDMAPTGLHNYQPFPMSRYPQLMAYVAMHYVAVPDFMGAKVFRRKDLPVIP